MLHQRRKKVKDIAGRRKCWKGKRNCSDKMSATKSCFKKNSKQSSSNSGDSGKECRRARKTAKSIDLQKIPPWPNPSNIGEKAWVGVRSIIFTKNNFHTIIHTRPYFWLDAYFEPCKVQIYRMWSDPSCSFITSQDFFETGSCAFARKLPAPYFATHNIEKK